MEKRFGPEVLHSPIEAEVPHLATANELESCSRGVQVGRCYRELGSGCMLQVVVDLLCWHLDAALLRCAAPV
jgi:hypothetical protein